MEDSEKPKAPRSLVEIIRDVYQVENVVYYSNDLSNNQVTGFTYSPEWAKHYETSKLQNVDPVVRCAQRQFHPIDWKKLDWSSKKSRELFREASNSGVGNQGLTVPIRGPLGQFAVLTINDTTSDEKWQSFIKDYTQDMLVISHYLHKTLHEKPSLTVEENQKELSPRERDVLSLLAIGNNRAQIADALGISEHTVRVYLDTARTKLGAINTTQAVVLALQSGSIRI